MNKYSFTPKHKVSKPERTDQVQVQVKVQVRV